MKKMKGVIKKLLYQDKVINDFSNESGIEDLTDKELGTLKLVYNTIKPYKPMKGKRGVIHQLPLVVLSQPIATCCGYSIKSKLCPSPSPSTVLSLQPDAATIYRLIKSIGDGYKILKKDGFALSSERDAVWNKNYVFGSVFSLQKIYQLCRLYNIEFIYNIMVRPGLKTCPVLGESTNAEVFHRREKLKDQEKPKEYAPINAFQRAGTERDLKKANSKIKTLNDDLLQLKKVHTVRDLDKEIKDLKNAWRLAIGNDDKRSSLYYEIEDVKRKRDDFFYKKDEMQRELNSLKRQAYLMREVPYILI
jgi:hypothetical protein